MKDTQALDTKSAGVYLGLNERTLKNWRWLKKGPAYRKLGGRVVYHRADLDEFSESKIVVPANEVNCS